MAQYNITGTVQKHNLTIDDLKASPFWNDISDQADGLFIRSRQSQAAFYRWVEDNTTAAPEDVAQELTSQPAPKATAKQVAFMMRLIADSRHEGAYESIPTDYDTLVNLPRKLASHYIDVMLNN